MREGRAVWITSLCRGTSPIEYFAHRRLRAARQTREVASREIEELRPARPLQRLHRGDALLRSVVFDDPEQELGGFESVDPRERAHCRGAHRGIWGFAVNSRERIERVGEPKLLDRSCSLVHDGRIRIEEGFP